jgi:hypothetical protein
LGLEVRDRVLGLKDINFSRNEALACEPEIPRPGGPPEHSEGVEGRGIEWLVLFTQMKKKHVEGCIN